MTVTPTITLADQIACAARELKIRQGVYPKWVRSDRMKQDVADIEIARMAAILETLKSLRTPTRIALGEAAFQQLVAGGVVLAGQVQIILSDIGHGQMLFAIEEAMRAGMHQALGEMSQILDESHT